MRNSTTRQDFIGEIARADSINQVLVLLAELNEFIDWEKFERSANSGSIRKRELQSVGESLEKLTPSTPGLSLLAQGLLGHLSTQLKRGDTKTLRSTVSQLLSSALINNSL